jgi:hypothetical protein
VHKKDQFSRSQDNGYKLMQVDALVNTIGILGDAISSFNGVDSAAFRLYSEILRTISDAAAEMSRKPSHLSTRRNLQWIFKGGGIAETLTDACNCDNDSFVPKEYAVRSRLVLSALRLNREVEYLDALEDLFFDGESFLEGKPNSSSWFQRERESCDDRYFELGHTAASLNSPYSLELLRNIQQLRPDMAFCLDSEGSLPLHRYVKRGSEDTSVLNYLLELNPGAINTPLCNVGFDFAVGATPLHSILSKCRPSSHIDIKLLLEKLTLLLSHGAPSFAALSESCYQRDLPLHVTITSGYYHKEIILKILDAYPGAAMVPSVVNAQAGPPLMLFLGYNYNNDTSKEDFDEVFWKLLEACDDIAMMSTSGFKSTPLHLAAASRHITLLQLQRIYELYPAAISINLPGVGTPLHAAVGGGCAEKIKYLFSLCPSSALEFSAGDDQRTPLFWAICSLDPIKWTVADADARKNIVNLMCALCPEAVSLREKNANSNLPFHGALIAYTFAKFLWKRSKCVNVPQFEDTAETSANLRQLLFDICRTLLRYYPDAAIETMKRADRDRTYGADSRTYSRPIFGPLRPLRFCEVYDINTLADPICREIMLAAPSCYDQQLRLFNYRERRGAIYLLFSTTAGDALRHYALHRNSTSERSVGEHDQIKNKCGAEPTNTAPASTPCDSTPSLTSAGLSSLGGLGSGSAVLLQGDNCDLISDSRSFGAGAVSRSERGINISDNHDQEEEGDNEDDDSEEEEQEEEEEEDDDDEEDDNDNDDDSSSYDDGGSSVEPAQRCYRFLGYGDDDDDDDDEESSDEDNDDDDDSHHSLGMLGSNNEDESDDDDDGEEEEEEYSSSEDEDGSQGDDECGYDLLSESTRLLQPDDAYIWHLLRDHGDQMLLRHIVKML